MNDDKNVLFVSRKDDRIGFDTANSMCDLLQASSSGKIKYSASYLENILFSYDGKTLKCTDTLNKLSILNYDCVFLLGWFKKRRHEDIALAISIYLKHHNKLVFNSEAYNNRSRSKLSQLVIATLNGINVTPFYSIIEPDQLNDPNNTLNMGFPLILKSASASRGGNNFLANSQADLVESAKRIPKKIKLIQKFIENDGDFRIIVINNEVKMVIKRKSVTGSHLNNTSLGGKAVIVSPDSLDGSMLEQSVKISQLLGREVTGVDMIQDIKSGEYYFLEVNNMPQLSTGSFVKEKGKVLNTFFEELLQNK